MANSDVDTPIIADGRGAQSLLSINVFLGGRGEMSCIQVQIAFWRPRNSGGQCRFLRTVAQLGPV